MKHADPVHIAKMILVVEQLTDLTTARAMLVCEDAREALAFAIAARLTVPEVLAVMREEAGPLQPLKR